MCVSVFNAYVLNITNVEWYSAPIFKQSFKAFYSLGNFEDQLLKILDHFWVNEMGQNQNILNLSVIKFD